MKGENKQMGSIEHDAETSELLERIAAHGEETRRLVEAVQKRTARQYTAARGDEDKQAVAIEAMGWEEEGKRHLQTGFMFLKRAVNQPTSFAG